MPRLKSESKEVGFIENKPRNFHQQDLWRACRKPTREQIEAAERFLQHRDIWDEVKID